MQFTRRSVFEHWIRLEADPSVTSFCERPASAVVNGQPIAIDFWVQSDDDEELVLLMPGDRDPDLPEQVLGLPLAQIPLAERTAHDVHVRNWQRLITTINAASSSISTVLLDEICQAVTSPIALARIERQFSGRDVATVRATIFELLRVGRLTSPGLERYPLSLNTLIEPVQ